VLELVRSDMWVIIDATCATGGGDVMNDAIVIQLMMRMIRLVQQSPKRLLQ
jgi:hypothetical protein